MGVELVSNVVVGVGVIDFVVGLDVVDGIWVWLKVMVCLYLG